ncbi:hypothetical protein BJV74DRAFT_883085 [Russula compacta]|nr:hypothetical protein BJV74DRAFT_883085 [Russula compacta]
MNHRSWLTVLNISEETGGKDGYRGCEGLKAAHGIDNKDEDVDDKVTDVSDQVQGVHDAVQDVHDSAKDVGDGAVEKIGRQIANDFGDLNRSSSRVALSVFSGTEALTGNKLRQDITKWLSARPDILRVQRQAPAYIIVEPGMQSPREEVHVLVEELVALHFLNPRLCITSLPEVDIRTVLEP